MVGIRSMGLAVETVIGFESDGKEFCMVPEYQLRNLVEISNDRFKENTKRIENFRRLLLQMESEKREKRSMNGGHWEDAEVRRERKRAEGLKKAQIIKQTAHEASELLDKNLEVGLLEQNT
jgi:tRNA wybutosine-synthesizing protein 3